MLRWAPNQQGSILPLWGEGSGTTFQPYSGVSDLQKKTAWFLNTAPWGHRSDRWPTSQSLEVRMGVCTYWNPRSWKNLWIAKAQTFRIRITHPITLVRTRRWPAASPNPKISQPTNRENLCATKQSQILDQCYKKI